MKKKAICLICLALISFMLFSFEVSADTTKPSIKNATITPASPSTVNDLVCSAFTGNDTTTSNSTTGYFNWYKNNALNLTEGFTFPGGAAGWYLNSSKILHGNLTATERWICNVNLTDGAGITYINSSYVEVSATTTTTTILPYPECETVTEEASAKVGTVQAVGFAIIMMGLLTMLLSVFITKTANLYQLAISLVLISVGVIFVFVLPPVVITALTTSGALCG